MGEKSVHVQVVDVLLRQGTMIVKKSKVFDLFLQLIAVKIGSQVSAGNCSNGLLQIWCLSAPLAEKVANHAPRLSFPKEGRNSQRR